jgi:hypothetical protein
LLLIFVAVASAVAAAFWAIQRDDATDEVGGAMGVPPEGAGTPAGPVQDFLQFAAGLQERGATGSPDAAEYVAEGLRKLAGALGALNLGNPEIQIDIRVAAEHLLLNPTSAAITPVIRSALISAADALESAHTNRAGRLRGLAESLETVTPVIDQQPTLHGFFRECAALMQATQVQD